MPEKDRYATLIDFLKVLITLASAILVAAAGAYLDQSKIPTDNTKYVLLAAIICLLVTIISSITAIGLVNNLIVNTDFLKLAEKRWYAGWATEMANASYGSFVVFALLLGLFFLLRTLGASTAVVAGDNAFY